MSAGLYYDDRFLDHDTGKGHPERPARLRAVVKHLKDKGLWDKLEHPAFEPAERKTIELVHKPAYIDRLEQACKEGKPFIDVPDSAISAQSAAIAYLMAGAALDAVDQVATGKLDRVFVLGRPPGHHATPSRGMGFCFFNNVAIAARHAQAKHDIERVLIVDWDVHHGNGTQDIFYEDGSVFFFSTHQSPWYPHTGKAEETGKGEGEGATLNCPFPAGTGMKDIGDAFYHKLAPAMEKFKPQFIFISAGFDSRVDDPLGRFKLEDKDFVTLTNVLLDMADKYAEGRVVSVLEGGYNLEGLAKSATAHVGALMKA